MKKCVCCTGLPSRNGSFPAKDWTRAHNWLGATRSCEEYYTSTGMSQNHNFVTMHCICKFMFCLCVSKGTFSTTWQIFVSPIWFLSCNHFWSRDGAKAWLSASNFNREKDMIVIRSYTQFNEIKCWKKFRPEHDSNLWPLGYRHSPLPTESWSHPEECKCMYERPYIWTSEKDMKTWLIIAVNQFN